MAACDPVQLPMNPALKPTDSELLNTEKKDLFLAYIGSLNWLSTRTRPDIQTALAKLRRRSHVANTNDYTALQHLIRYLKGSTNRSIQIDGNGTLIGYVDSSHADCEAGRSTEGFFLCMEQRQYHGLLKDRSLWLHLAPAQSSWHYMTPSKKRCGSGNFSYP